MSRPSDARSPKTWNDDPRAAGKWARRYAQNRSLGMVASMLIFLVLWAAIAGPSYLGGNAYRSGHWAIFWACIAVLVVAVAALIYFSVPRWGGKMMERVTKRLYAREGTAQLVPPTTRGRHRLGALLGAAFGISITATVTLGVLGFIPDKYMQPVSALCSVPFLVALWLLMRPAGGPIMLLWPALYALHAVLIVAGAPILFNGRWDSLNMLIPVAGYGLLTGLTAHAYSRFALWRLRRVARGGFREEAPEDPQS